MNHRKRSRLIAVVMSIALIVTMMPVMASAVDGMNKYTFYFEKPSSSALNYRVVKDAMESRFVNETGEEAWAMEINGRFKVDVTCNDVITYKDLLGEEGVLRNIYSGGVQTPDNYIGVGTKPSPDDYANEAEFESECNSETPIPITGAEFYTLTATMISYVYLTLDAPSCGTVVSFDSDNLTVSEYPKFTAVGEAHFSIPEGIPEGADLFTPKSIWLKDPEELFPLEDTMVGDNTYYALTALIPDFGYKFSDNMPADHIAVNGEPATIVLPIGGTHIDVFASVDVVHDFDEGKVTKEPTATEEGVRTFTCKGGCGATREESIPKIEPVPTPEPTPETKPEPSPAVNTSAGTTHNVSGNTYKVLSGSTVAFSKAANKKSVTVPATVKIGGKTFSVVQVSGKAFTAKKIRTVTIGAKVKKIAANAFKSSKATKMIVKTKLLKKAGVKKSLKGSKIKTVQVKVGKKSANKKFVKKYKKIFTKKNAGKKVSVK